MQKHVRKWVTAIALNVAGLLVSLVLVYFGALAVLLQVSTRATARNPYFAVDGLDLLATIAGLIAIGFVFRFCGKLYELLTNVPKPE